MNSEAIIVALKLPMGRSSLEACLDPSGQGQFQFCFLFYSGLFRRPPSLACMRIDNERAGLVASAFEAGVYDFD